MSVPASNRGKVRAGTDSGNECAQWHLYFQLRSPKDLDKFDSEPLDDTQVLTSSIVEHKAGTLTLDRILGNRVESTKESALAPSRPMPGIEPSEDRTLWGRFVFYYPEVSPQTELQRIADQPSVCFGEQ